MAAPEDYLSGTGMAAALASMDPCIEAAGAALLASRVVHSPDDFLTFEKDVQRLGAAVADRIVVRKMFEAHLDKAFRKDAAREARQRLLEEGVSQRIDNMGPRAVSVRLAGGGVVQIVTPYLRPCRKGLAGRPRQTRGAEGSGRYPVLEKLGIVDGVTPLARSKVARQAVLCSSFAEAQEQLASDGLDLDVSTIVGVAVKTGSDAVALRDRALEEARSNPLPETSLVAGKRIRVSIDGGRARTRHTFRERRKGNNGRRAFQLEWKEPRVMTVDVLDDDGDMDRTELPIYETELGDADAVFATLIGLLRLIGANQAAEVVFVTDGADWIWNRLDQLIVDAELVRDRVHLILDYYHATEHISDALRACKDLSEAARKQVHEELCRELVKPDGLAHVIERLQVFAKGRRGRDVNKEIRYLAAHADHMNYAELRDRRIPIGSGVVESAVRRVLNLRFKSASMCWRPDHLGPLLYLRAILKSGRWDEFTSARLKRRHWLTPPASPVAPQIREVA